MYTEQLSYGPYWDFVEANRYFCGKRDVFAALAADEILAFNEENSSDDPFRALRFAARYRRYADAAERCIARYDALRDTPTEDVGWAAARSYDAPPADPWAL